MAKHGFGIMQTSPRRGERYDEYNPEKYNAITIDDDFIEPILQKLDEIDFYWHTVDIKGKGLAYCGVTLIPPSSMALFIKTIENIAELNQLRVLLEKAASENKFIIHFGI